MFHFVLLISVQGILLQRECSSFSLGWGHKTHRTCSPEHMFCTHSEQCCGAGICVHRVYMRVIKIKQCTTMDHLELLSPEEQMTYLQSEALRDNITRLGGRLRLVQNPDDIDPKHPLSLIRLMDDTQTATTSKEANLSTALTAE